MSDTKLLKLAALAVGLGEFLFINGQGCVYEPKPGIMQPYREWNPLTDDGNAFQLVVQLKMMIDFITKPATAYMLGHVVAVCNGAAYYELGFTPEATRRAIVRAAAGIGMELA